MATLYLFEQDSGSDPIVCSGSVNAGNATWIGDGYFLTATDTNCYLYHLDGNAVELKKTVTADNLRGVAAVREELTGRHLFDNGLFFATIQRTVAA